MVAYAALVSLSKVIDLALSQEHKYVHLCSRDQMISLHEEIGRLQDLLEHLSGRSESSINELESRIRDVAYHLEDIIEGAVLTSSFPVEITTPSIFRSHATEISILLEQGRLVVLEMKENNLQDKDTSGTPRPLTTPSSSSEAPSAKLDLNEVPVKIMDLTFGRGSKLLQIIPITGMGGIGKTTLASAVYQHPNTLRHFDICSWVTVSQQYDVREILRGLLPSDQRSEPDERLIEFVHKRLIGQRYLIVLDDMWDVKAWDHIRNAFPDDKKGSRIILTTRLLDVAAYVGSSSQVHEMPLLNEEQSWDLLREKVGGNKHWPKILEHLGRRVATNCRGLPLAVVAMAGLLKFNMTEEYWEQVARDTKSEMNANYDERLLGILGLSYNNLPPYLKPCFLYFGLFKEDSEIRTEELVRLWRAERFLKPRGSKEMEEVAEEYLEELVARSLVMVKKKKKHDGRIKTCSIHDVLRDLILRKAHEEKFSRNLDSYPLRKAGDDLRRVSSHSIGFSDMGKLLSSNTHVRSLLCQDRYYSDQLPDIIPNFRLMRVLSAVPIRENPQFSVLYELTNLRYLHIDISYYPEDSNLPPTVGGSISKLQKLETLIFSGRWHMGGFDKYPLVLPSEIWEMPRLRHLIILVRESILPCPATLGQISCAALQTLTGVTNFDLSRSTVAKFSDLNKLKLRYNSYYPDGHQTLFRLDNLVHLHQLEHLTIKSNPETFVSDLSFPHKLKKLSLESTEMPVEKMSAIGSLPNLEVLKLKWLAVNGKVWEPIEGEFVQLKYLKMQIVMLEEWRAESEHFPQLETLIVKGCWDLKEVPAGIGEINTLQKLVLIDCSLAKESVKKIKAEQESLCNDLLQVIIR